MILYHVTPRDNLPGILTQGVRPDLARGRRKAVWAVPASRRAWAVLYVALRHAVPVERVVIVRIRPNKGQFKAHGSGLYYSPELVRPSQIKAIATWVEVAGSVSNEPEQSDSPQLHIYQPEPDCSGPAK